MSATIATILRILLDGPKLSSELAPVRVVSMFTSPHKRALAVQECEKDAELLALELARAEGLGMCVAENVQDGKWFWKLTDEGLKYCTATIKECEEMARKSKVKVETEEPEVETEESYQDKFDAAVLKATRLGANNYTTIRKDVVSTQRVIPQGPQEDWGREFNKSLLRLIHSHQITVTNGKYWVRTGAPPEAGYA